MKKFILFLLFASIAVTARQQEAISDTTKYNKFMATRRLINSSIDGYARIFKDTTTVKQYIYPSGYGYTHSRAMDAFVWWPLAMDAAIRTAPRGNYYFSPYNNNLIIK